MWRRRSQLLSAVTTSGLVVGTVTANKSRDSASSSPGTSSQLVPEEASAVALANVPMC